MNSPIIIDTREQKPYKFYGNDVIHKKLDTGDYSIEGFENIFATERKSLNDYTQSITSGRERFENEVERGSELEEFSVIIEASEDEVRQGNYRSQVAPLSCINTAKAWSDRYNVEFIWADSRAVAKALTLQKLNEWYDVYSDGSG